MKPENQSVKPMKASMLSELQDRVSGALYMILTDYTGMDMPTTDALKSSLREQDAAYNVVNNRLAKRVLSVDGVENMLKGQTAMICGSGDVVEVAKIIKKFTKDTSTSEFKGGILEGKLLSADEVGQLAALPPKQVLQGMLVGTLAAPMTQVVGVMSQKVSSLLYVLNAVADKKEQEA